IAYTLVTAVETGDATLVHAARGDRWTRTARRGAVRAPLVPLVAPASTLGVLLLLPAGAVARIRSPHPGDSIRGSARRDASRRRLSPPPRRLEAPGDTHTPAARR